MGPRFPRAQARSLRSRAGASRWLVPAAMLVLALCAAAQGGRDEKGKGDKRDKKDEKKAPAPAEIEPWLGDYDAALVEARERNAPLTILAILEGEPTSDRVRDEIFHGAEFIAVAAPTVFLLVNDGDHAPKTVVEETPGGEKVERTVCSAFGVPTCADHRRSWKRVFQEHSEGVDMVVPALIVLLPNGKQHGRKQDEIHLKEAVEIVSAARAAAGPSLGRAELVLVKEKLQSADSLEKARIWPEVWRNCSAVLAITTQGMWADRAREASDRAVAALRQEIDDTVRGMEEGRVEEGYEHLLEREPLLEGTPLEKPIRDAIAKAERNKDWKDVIKAVQRRREAEALWQKCEAAIAEGKEAQAERQAAALIRRFPDTPAAAKARARFPALANETPPGQSEGR